MIPKVSIIIPCFNAMPYLEQTMESVFGQSYSNVEVIVIDDGSDDGSYEYLKNLEDKISLLKNKDKGACAARNYGYEISKGDYIQFLDADDLLSADKIEKQVALLLKNPCHVAVCSTKHFNDSPSSGKITDTSFMFSTNQPHKFLLNLYGANGNHEMVQTSAWLIPRGLIDKAGLWDESLSKDQDGEFFCRVLMTSDGVVYEPEGINFYRKHRLGKNIANKNERKHLLSQLAALNSKADVLSAYKNTHEYKKAMALQYKILSINAYPLHKDISDQSMKISNGFGGSVYLPILGGKIIEFLKFNFGWKLAKSVRNLYHKTGLIWH